MNRILFIYNPYSSNYVRVRDEVLQHITRIKGHVVGKFSIKKAPFETNVVALKKVLRNGDTVISVGGDATASVAANAILESKKDVTLGVLPYGNFNDLARTLGMLQFSDIFVESGPDLKASFTTEKLYPLDIIADGKHWRYATCYVTMGMTAEAVELFDEPKIRKKLQEGHKSSWRSYLYLMKWYFKNRHKKQFIPDFKLNGLSQHRKTTDYAAVNGRSMCRVMKGGFDYRAPNNFQSMTDRLANLWRLTKLMTKSILKRTPGEPTTEDTIEFLKPSTVELQAEGEYKIFENVKTITVTKDGSCLKVIRG